MIMIIIIIIIINNNADNNANHSTNILLIIRNTSTNTIRRSWRLNFGLRRLSWPQCWDERWVAVRTVGSYTRVSRLTSNARRSLHRYPLSLSFAHVLVLTSRTLHWSNAHRVSLSPERKQQRPAAQGMPSMSWVTNWIRKPDSTLWW